MIAEYQIISCMLLYSTVKFYFMCFDSLHCLFCNKVFKNQTVLKEHMRKKQHKTINPKDTEFDKFYIINYLEMGKNWHQVQVSLHQHFCICFIICACVYL
jgi:hypothetical protein